MFYTIYKTTNLLNGKFYIGKHQTNNLDDGYVGSGKLLRRAINKYGIENFSTVILEVYDEEWKMNLAEKILVVIDQDVSYNLCPGGHGGFGYINKNKLTYYGTEQHTINYKIAFKKGPKSLLNLRTANAEFASTMDKNISNGLLNYYKNNKSVWVGKNHTENTKLKLSLIKKGTQAGSKNSQYGTCWITNGIENKKIPKDDIDIWVALGYYKGRAC